MAWMPLVKCTDELFLGGWLLKGAYCILLPWDFGIGGFYIVVTSPRRHGRQLRPPPAESLAFGRGRRHISYVGYIFDLFREVRVPVRGVQQVLRLHGEVPRSQSTWGRASTPTSTSSSSATTMYISRSELISCIAGG